jgi:solute carrier family 39 (zinc transporter), member 1/2/3
LWQSITCRCSALRCTVWALQDSRREFLLLLIAIASHKLISGVALSSRFLKDGATTAQITLYVAPFALIAPTAIAAGASLRGVGPMLTLLLSCFATGTFLYVGASEIVEEEFEGDPRAGRVDISATAARWAKFAALLAGVGAIAALSMLPDVHDHGGGGGLGAHGHDHAHGGVHHHHHH